MRPSTSRALAAVLLLLALPAISTADVSAEVLSGDRIKGTLDPANEVETYFVDCPGRTLLNVKASGKRRGPNVDVRVFAPDGAEISVGSVAVKGRSARIADLAVPSTGRYRVEVTSRDGATTGDYGLSIVCASAKKLGGDVTLDGIEDSLTFGAGAGTRISAKLAAAKGSPALPEFARLTGPDGFDQVFGGGVGKTAGGLLAPLDLPRSGTYTLSFRSTGDAGDAKLSVRLRAPKPAKTKIDLRSKKIGSGTDGDFAVAAVLGSGGGSVAVPVSVDPAAQLIAGALVAVPPGALSEPTPIIVGTAPELNPGKVDDGAGPTVFFGPERKGFENPLTVTIPFDPSQFGADLSDLIVKTRDEKGKVRVVPPPYDVDVVAGTVTFPVSHFSSFRATQQGVSGQGLVGAWKEVPDGFHNSWLVLSSNKDVVLVQNFDDDVLDCSISDISSGVKLSSIFEIKNGRLRFKFSSGQDLEFVRVSPASVPTGCDDL
jgi:hypothetical protein